MPATSGHGSEETLPALQDVQLTEPFAFEYFPGSHWMQAMSPAELANDPEVQISHAVEPGGEEKPGWHVLLQLAAPSAVENVPG